MENEKQSKLTQFFSALVEIGFIIFLFYANLLMGEYTKSGFAKSKGLEWALNDIFTLRNFVIALVAAVIGHFVFQFLRNKL